MILARDPVVILKLDPLIAVASGALQPAVAGAGNRAARLLVRGVLIEQHPADRRFGALTAVADHQRTELRQIFVLLDYPKPDAATLEPAEVRVLHRRRAGGGCSC